MPAKKADTKTTTAKKGSASVEETKKKTAAGTKTKKAAATTKAKKTTAKKTETLKDDKTAVQTKKTTVKKTAEKKEVKKAAPKKTTKAKKLEQYRQFSLDTCIDMAHAMGIELGYNEYAGLLLEQSDEKAIAKQLLKEAGITSKSFTFDEDGYDADLMEVLINKVSETVDLKAADFETMGKDIKEHETYEIADDSTANNAEYDAQFNLVKRLLMLAQRKDLSSMEEVKAIVGEDATALVGKFMDVAAEVLKLWQYEDVKFYEGFIYSVLSRFDDLHEQYGNRAMMDVADLYIEHGDYGMGDANYGYILRENEIKDYIYFRYASVYRDIDRQKSCAIANEALQFVDDRYTYHEQIVALLED